MNRFSRDKKKKEEKSEDSARIGMMTFSGGKVEEKVLTAEEAAEVTPSIVAIFDIGFIYYLKKKHPS